MEEYNRIGFPAQVPGGCQSRQTRADNRHAEALGRQGQGPARGDVCRHAGQFQTMDGDAAAQVPAQADIFAGMITDEGHNARQGHVALQHLAGLSGPALGHAGHKGAHIEVKGAGRSTARRAFLGTVGFYSVQALLIQQHGFASPAKVTGEMAGCPIPPKASRLHSDRTGALNKAPAEVGQACPYFFGMAASTFSGRAGRWVTRAPQV